MAQQPGQGIVTFPQKKPRSWRLKVDLGFHFSENGGQSTCGCNNRHLVSDGSLPRAEMCLRNVYDRVQEPTRNISCCVCSCEMRLLFRRCGAVGRRDKQR